MLAFYASLGEGRGLWMGISGQMRFYPPCILKVAPLQGGRLENRLLISHAFLYSAMIRCREGTGMSGGNRRPLRTNSHDAQLHRYPFGRSPRIALA